MQETGHRKRSAERGRAAGFTLVEMLLVVVILGTLSALAVPNLARARERAAVARATGDIKALQVDIETFFAGNGRLPNNLTELGRATLRDPWGNVYVYTRIAGGTATTGQLRKDKFLVPLNSDYDLYSKGLDGQTKPPLNAAVSKDDVVRAGDGAYVGLASEY